MAHIKCSKDGKWYEIETGRNLDGPVYRPGSILLHGCPFPGVPLELGLAVTPDGEVLFRHWEFSGQGDEAMRVDNCTGQVTVTAAMLHTLQDMMDGKLLFDGLRLKLTDGGEGSWLGIEPDAVYAADYLTKLAT